LKYIFQDKYFYAELICKYHYYFRGWNTWKCTTWNNFWSGTKVSYHWNKLALAPLFRILIHVKYLT